MAATDLNVCHTRSWLARFEIDARHLDDGLPRGFLSGAIVEVWVTLRLNWACELPLSQA